MYTFRLLSRLIYKRHKKKRENRLKDILLKFIHLLFTNNQQQRLKFNGEGGNE